MDRWIVQVESISPRRDRFGARYIKLNFCSVTLLDSCSIRHDTYQQRWPSTVIWTPQRVLFSSKQLLFNMSSAKSMFLYIDIDYVEDCVCIRHILRVNVIRGLICWNFVWLSTDILRVRKTEGKDLCCPQTKPLLNTRSSRIRHFSSLRNSWLWTFCTTIYEEPHTFARTSRGTLHFPLNVSAFEITEQMEPDLLRHICFFKLLKRSAWQGASDPLKLTIYYK
jgi:hypothetical protein